MTVFNSLVSLGFVLALTSLVQAVTFSFVNISANGPANALTGQSQLTVDVSEACDGQVLFTFANEGSSEMSVDDVYFQGGPLLGIADLVDGDQDGGDPGVDFSTGARPRNLPSGRNAPLAPFVATKGFTADSDPAVQHNGVNPRETLGVIFDLKNGQTFSDVVSAITLGLLNPNICGSLRIGDHVQGFSGGGSESFVNGGIVPEPSSVLVWLIAGTTGVALIRRRRPRNMTEN